MKKQNCTSVGFFCCCGAGDRRSHRTIHQGLDVTRLFDVHRPPDQPCHSPCALF